MHVADTFGNYHTMTEIENEIQSFAEEFEDHVEEDTYIRLHNVLVSLPQPHPAKKNNCRAAWEPGDNIAASCRKEWWWLKGNFTTLFII